MASCIVIICLLAFCILIASLFIMGVWNWLLGYLAWSMFSYALPSMNLWQAICVYFVLAIICMIFKSTKNNN